MFLLYNFSNYSKCFDTLVCHCVCLSLRGAVIDYLAGGSCVKSSVKASLWLDLLFLFWRVGEMIMGMHIFFCAVKFGRYSFQEYFL